MNIDKLVTLQQIRSITGSMMFNLPAESKGIITTFNKMAHEALGSSPVTFHTVKDDPINESGKAVNLPIDTDGIDTMLASDVLMRIINDQIVSFLDSHGMKIVHKSDSERNK